MNDEWDVAASNMIVPETYVWMLVLSDEGGTEKPLRQLGSTHRLIRGVLRDLWYE